MDHHEPQEHEEHHKVEEHHAMHVAPHKSKPNSVLLVLGIALALLIVVAGVQAVELTKIKKQLEDEKTTLVASSGAAGSSSLKNSLDSLPSMVGGC